MSDIFEFARGLLADGFDRDALMRRMTQFEQATDDTVVLREARELFDLAVANATRFVETEGRAVRDPLTGLYTRTYALARLEEELSRARRRSANICALMIDIADLDEINTKYGFPSGDAAIRTAGAALKSACRISDVVCRYDGDRFLVIYVDVVPEATASMAKRACEQIESRVLPVPGGAIGLKTRSGLALSTPETSNAATLVGVALAAMQKSKAGSAVTP
jgi:diguanylate cyclase (GGDEF)-like protein